MERFEREAIDKVIKKLEEDDLAIVVSIEHDGVVAVRHRWSCGTAEWKAELVKAPEDVGVKMTIKEYRSPDEILEQLRRLHLECDWDRETSSALELEQKRVNLGQGVSRAAVVGAACA